ncbi:unnamed protein product, partial [Choristocarpus tenellus]
MAGIRSKFPQAQAWTFALPDSTPTPSVRESSTCLASRIGNWTDGGIGPFEVPGSKGCSSVRVTQNTGVVGHVSEQGKDKENDISVPRRAQNDPATIAEISVEVQGPSSSEYSDVLSTKATAELEANTNKKACGLEPKIGAIGVRPTTTRYTETRKEDQAGTSILQMSPSSDEFDRISDNEELAQLVREMRMLPGGAVVDFPQLVRMPGVMDCLTELLRDRQRQLASLDNVSHQLRRVQTDAEQRTNEINTLSARLEASEQESAALERRRISTVEEHRTEKGRWHLHRHELETRAVQLESRDVQYRAALRKKDVDYKRLQDSMQRTVIKERGSVRGMEMNLKHQVAARARGGGVSGKDDTGSEGTFTPLGGLINMSLKNRVDELTKENTSLRSMLGELQSDLMELKEYQENHHDLVSARSAAALDESCLSAREEALPEELEGMSAEWLRNRLGDKMVHQIFSMRQALLRVMGDSAEGAQASGAPGAGGVVVEAEEDVRAKLREARSLLQQQDSIMLAAIFDKPGAAVTKASALGGLGGQEGEDLGGGDGQLDASFLWESRERLDQE